MDWRILRWRRESCGSWAALVPVIGAPVLHRHAVWVAIWASRDQNAAGSQSLAPDLATVIMRRRLEACARLRGLIRHQWAAYTGPCAV